MATRRKRNRPPRVYVTVTDPKTKKSVGTTVPGTKMEVVEKIEKIFAAVTPPSHFATSQPSVN